MTKEKRSDAMPFWTDAFVSDTINFNTEQVGAYMQLLIFGWRARGLGLPNDDKQLATITKLSKAKWKGHKELLLEKFWLDENNKLHQKRQLEEWEKRLAFIASQSEKGQKSAAKRASEKNSPKNARDFHDDSSEKFSYSSPPKGNKNNAPSSTEGATGQSTERQPAVAVADIDSSTLAAGDNFDWKFVLDKCLEAASGAMCPITIHTYRKIKLWLNAEPPCLLEEDILPAIRDGASRKQGDNMRGWNYFEPIVLQYRDERLQGIPKPERRKNDGNNNAGARRASGNKGRKASQTEQHEARRARRAELLKRRAIERGDT